MKFTLNWLKEYIDPELPAAEIAHRLTMAGLEVDSVTELGRGLEDIRVARVVEVRPHPNADKLTLCRVAVGSDEYQVVCGAPNVRAEMLTAIALPGAVLPSGLTIRKAKLRGEASEGMLCSEKELGLSEAQAGIMELLPPAESGQPLAAALDLTDTVIEVDLTPNRPDCASVLGIAREVGSFSGRRVTPPLRPEELPAPVSQGENFKVEVQDPEGCPRYAALLLKDVQVGPSPGWLCRRLQAVGLRPINNVVDITNFVMLEYGQPLHAFDFDLLAGGKIVVRRAATGEAITTLDGVGRELDPTMLAICDAEKPVAIAGIMGGENSEVSGATTRILLESAYFSPVSIRQTARRLKISTDASYRFERGVDPQGPPLALERAARLLQEIAGAVPVEAGVDCRQPLPEPPAITLREERTNRLLGTTQSADQIRAVLESIEIRAEVDGPGRLTVHPPSFRVDLEREVDLIEEVARLTGYNAIPTTLPVIPMRFSETEPLRRLRSRLAEIMTSLGFFEAINYSFVSVRHCDQLGLQPEHPARSAVTLLNPLVEEQSILRTTLLPGLLENVRQNLNHQQADVRLFEIGKMFQPTTPRDQPVERHHLAAVFSGRRQPGTPLLYAGEAGVDIYDVKGVAEQLFQELRLAQVTFEPAAEPLSYAAPGQSLALQTPDGVLGTLGRLADEVLKRFGLKQEVFYLELDLEMVCRLESIPKLFEPLPKFPAARWDAAFLVPEEARAGEILAAIEGMGETIIEKAEIFDIYRGKPIAAGRKSVGIAITYRSREQTLDDEAIGRVHQKIIQMIRTKFDGQLREL